MNVKKPRLWTRIVNWLKQASSQETGTCRNCAVCHHVCDLLGKKNRAAVRTREE